MNRHNLLLTVIIPMYNCGEIITRCLDSIDFPDAEIIVVDDGSVDNGATIVRRYIETHPRVRLLEKENGGVSSARNMGIEAAQGKYIIFIDADDYLVKDGIQTILSIAEAEAADIVKYKITVLHKEDAYDDCSLKNFPIQIETIQGKGAALKRYDISDYHVVDAAFKRDTIMQHHIRFNEDLHLREDDVFMGKFYCIAERVVVTNLPLYRYIGSSPFSSTHNQSKERNRLLIQSGLSAIYYRSQFIQEHIPNETYPYERLKYMRWVCSARQAVEAGYSYKEYLDILRKFQEIHVWPVSYKWVKIAGWDYHWKMYLKKLLFTFLLNHPLISYPIAKYRYK